MSGKFDLVFVRRASAGAVMDACRPAVVYNDHRDSDRAAVAFFPFGKEVQYGGGTISLLANIVWLIVSGIPLAVGATINGLLLCITIIGIPFGLQCFKIAKLALMPFGATIVRNS